MFRLKQKNEKKYKGSKLYVTKYDDVEIETLLSIIVSVIEGYVYQEHTIPDRLVLSSYNYNRIYNHNKSLIKKIDNKAYTFGVEIETI